MKKTLLLLVVLLSITSFSQEIKKVHGRYFINDTQLSTRQTRDLLASKPEALSLFKSAQNKESMGGFLVGIGSALVTVDLVIGLFSDVSYPTKATYGGLASLLVALPILAGRNKKIKKALTLYNDGLKNSAENNSDIEFHVIANQNGYGLQVRF